MANTTEQMESTSNPNINPVSDAAAQGFSFRKAFTDTAAERTALREEELIHVAFDIALAIDLVLAAVPRIERFAEEIAKLPGDHRFIAQLDVYAQAAGYAHARCGGANVVPEELKAIYEEALQRRAAMYSDTVNLVRYQLLSGDAIRAIKNETGFRNVGYDLMTLVNIFREGETRFAGRTGALPADVDQAERVAVKLILLTARRDEYQRTEPELGEDRLRSISLMVNCYQEARRAIQYLRFHHGDAEEIAPSIYTARSARKRSAGSDTPEEEVVNPPPAVSPPGATQPGAVAQAQADVDQEYPVVPLGAPGGSPFV